MPKYDFRRMKKIYDLINKGKERTLAGICYDLWFEFRKYKNKVIRDIDNLCELGFLITERETKNNTWFGVLPSEQNEKLYQKYFKEVNTNV